MNNRTPTRPVTRALFGMACLLSSAVFIPAAHAGVHLNWGHYGPSIHLGHGYSGYKSGRHYRGDYGRHQGYRRYNKRRHYGYRYNPRHRYHRRSYRY